MPSKSVKHLSLDEVIEIHRVLIEHFGGSKGLRDPGLLDSALYRTQSGYYHDLVEMAAALFESLIMNHPFVDGNKRVAFFATDVFLRMNGYQFQVKAKPAYRFLIGLLENNQCDYEHLLPWIHQSVVSLDD
ncbi:MAG: type II toxin-antitoxin system death-on-curing family toxin [Gammaproteobacteria bacterium]|nr:MAG: type II toxin-antitoxin system death-on-curing family toxin [Gammaproteobacteria bacterium]